MPFQIFRHGHRNALEGYPNDPYKDEATYWPEGYGQLTIVRILAVRSSICSLGIWQNQCHFPIVESFRINISIPGR